MIELEFSALSRLCLDRRISTFERLGAEVLAFLAQRDRGRIQINWQFSIQAAGQKLNSHYSAIHSDNSKFKIS